MQFDHHIFALTLWLMVHLQQVWDLLLFHLSALVRKFVLCLNMGQLVASPIPPTFEDKNAHVPLLTIVDY